MLEDNDILKLASLTRIKIAPEEVERFRNEIGGILEYVAKINEIKRGSQKASNLRVKNVFRSDDAAHESGIFTERLMESAPKREGDLVKVKEDFVKAKSVPCYLARQLDKNTYDMI